MTASPPSSPSDFIPFRWGKELYGRLARLSDLTAALTVGALAWFVSTFFYSPPFWLSQSGGGPLHSRIDDFIKYCQNPLTRDADPLLAYRVTTPVLAWLLGLRGFSGVIIQYAAIVATLALIFHVLARRTDRYLSLLVTLGVACSYTIIWTNTHAGFPDSVTHLAVVLALCAPNPFLIAGMVFLGVLNDERFVLSIPLIILWHAGSGSFGSMVRATWKLILGIAVGLAGVVLVRHALTVGWIGPGIPQPSEYKRFGNESVSWQPWEGWRVYLANIPLAFRAMWVVPLFFLAQKAARSLLPLKLLYLGCLVGVIATCAFVGDTARSISFGYTLLLLAAWHAYRTNARATIRVCGICLLICLLLPAFHVNYLGSVFWQRPLPLALLRAWTGWDMLQLFHHAPRS